MGMLEQIYGDQMSYPDQPAPIREEMLDLATVEFRLRTVDIEYVMLKAMAAITVVLAVNTEIEKLNLPS